MTIITQNLLPDNSPLPPAYFHTACTDFSQSSMKYPAGSQDFYQILLVLDGSGILHCGGKTFPLQRGCAFFTAMGYPSEYINTSGLTTAFLTAKGSAMPMLHALYHCGDFIFVEQIALEAYLEKIEEIIQVYYENKREGQLSALTYNFFVTFFEQQASSDLTPLAKTSLYIEQHFTDKLTLEHLAAISSVSISKLCHDFKAAYGCTIFQYILNLRLTYARSFLRASTQARIKEAALACGFDDISYFCKAYKKKFGKTPSEDQINNFQYGIT